MRRSSVYYPLRYIVQCQPAGQHFFEVIAAFNADSVAIDYAKDCHEFHAAVGGAAAEYKYRVLDHKNNENKCIYRSDVTEQRTKAA